MFCTKTLFEQSADLNFYIHSILLSGSDIVDYFFLYWHRKILIYRKIIINVNPSLFHDSLLFEIVFK